MTKMLKICLIFLSLLLLKTNLNAVEFILNDGSRVAGEIITFQNKIYTVQSTSLGTVKISTDKINRINYSQNKNLGQQNNKISSAQFQEINKSLMSNPAIFQQIQNLQSEPELQAIINDPEIMNSISKGDFQSLMNNKKIIQLMGNAKIKQIIGQVK